MSKNDKVWYDPSIHRQLIHLVIRMWYTHSNSDPISDYKANTYNDIEEHFLKHYPDMVKYLYDSEKADKYL